MEHTLVLEQDLNTTQGQKAASAGLAVLFTGLFLLIFWFIRIHIPDPPFEKPKIGTLEVDMEVIPPIPTPNSGGGSPEPAKGDHGGEMGGVPNPGGIGNVITEKESPVNAPTIEPPTSTSSSMDPRLKNRIGQGATHKGGTAGDPNGGKGTGQWKSQGPGPGAGQYKGAGGPGSGMLSYKFGNYKLNSSVTQVETNGSGIIVCSVQVDCDGRWSVVTYGSRGTTFTGSNIDLRNVVSYVLRNSTFVRTGDVCPEIGDISINVKSSY